MRRLSILGLLAVLLASSQIASGAVPELINFQGVLKNNGQPVSNGSHSMTFAIYSASTGGSPLWTETQSVTTSGGHFAVLLGSVTPIPASVFNASDRYLGITVPPDPELSPRQRLASVSFSYRVSTVDGATGGSIDGSLHLGAPDTLFASNVSSNSPLRLQTAGTTRMFVDDATGNIGIGTTAPGRKLVVSEGDISVTNTNSADDAVDLGLENSASGGHSWFIRSTSNGAGYGAGKLVFARTDAPDGGFLVAMTQEGNVGIGTAYPPNKLYVVGDAGASGDGGFGGVVTIGPCGWAPSWRLRVGGDIGATGNIVGNLFCSPSDGRYKTEIVPLTNVLGKLENLRGINFRWSDQFKSNHPEVTGRQIGVIAQEVERDFPELVVTGGDGYKSVDYGKLSAVLLEAIKEQQKEIEALKESVEKMRSERK